jgi:hypothetical protein
MKKKLLMLNFLMVFLVGINHAQTSYSSGYYPEDSIYFTVDWTIESDQVLQWSVNRFTEESFTPYQGGVWLKDRSNTPNSWENIHTYETVTEGASIESFTGTGINDLIIVGQDTIEGGYTIKLVVVENSPSGDVFDAYVVNPDSTTMLAAEDLMPWWENDQWVINPGDGWTLIFGSSNGYTVGDYWIIKIESFEPAEDTQCQYPSDNQQARGDLLKVNTVRVRIVDTVEQEIVREEIFIIGLGVQSHPKQHVLFATVDSVDVNEVMMNYHQDVKKRIYLTILSPSGNVEFSDFVEWDIAGASSRCLPNKGVAFKATTDVGGPKNMTTSLFGGSSSTKVDKIKFRVGGSGQYDEFGTHEIAQRIINDPMLKLGGVENTIGTWYLNGTYWSLGFPQEQPKKRYLEAILGIDKDLIEFTKPITTEIFWDSISPKTTLGDRSGWWLYYDQETMDSLELEEPSVFFSENYADLDNTVVIFNYEKQAFQAVLMNDDGDGQLLVEIAQLIHEHHFNGTISYQTLDSLIDIDSWLQFLSVSNYMVLYDVISANMLLATTPEHKLLIMIGDMDGAGNSPLWSNNWEYLLDNVTTHPLAEHYAQYYGLVHIVIELINQCPEALGRLALVYQDLLNTIFLTERTTQKVQEIEALVMPEYQTCHESWGGSPNGGQDAQAQAQMFTTVENFYANRPEPAAEMLADRFMSQENFLLSDRNQVKIIFDSIPSGIVNVKFNSLELTENFEGLYYPNPAVELIFEVSEGFDVTIKEFPQALPGEKLIVNADSQLTFTFLLEEFFAENERISVYPNPSSGNELVVTGTNSDQFMITSLQGKTFEVNSRGNSSRNAQISLDISFLQKGFYYLQEIDSGKITTFIKL